VETIDTVEAHNQSFLLTNRIGGFILLSNVPKSRYEGLYFKNKERIIKILESIRLHDSGKINTINYGMWNNEIVYDNQKESFFMPIRKDALIYELYSNAKFELIFDVKESYDDRVWGRNYAIEKIDDNITLISFVKKTDSREDSSHDEEEYKVYIAVYGSVHNINDSFEEHFYDLDNKRNSGNPRRWVYNAVTLGASGCILSYGMDKEKVIKNLLEIKGSVYLLKKEAEEHTFELVRNNICDHPQHNLAYLCSCHAIDHLTVIEGSQANLYAGLPWFFQYWARDELISLGGLIKTERFDEAVSIIKKYINLIGIDGRIPNRAPYSKLSSADGIGWLILRFEELVHALNQRHLTHSYFMHEEMKFTLEKIELGINALMRMHTKNEYAINASDETWMDTSWSGQDFRDGVRIEIQALFLRMYKFMHSITNNFKYKRAEEDLKAKIRQNMYHDDILADGLHDWTIRSNIFIAAYVYPDLLTKEEWKKVFDKALDSLFLEWGGIASISKDHPLFCPDYTGENNKSYHRGDSWYFVNNMAALVLSRVDSGHFSYFIEQIAKASSEEIINNGTIGHHAEVSSAFKMTSDGCTAQLWSSAMFIELMHELYRK
jgi:glycogen debranching enzyme